MKASSRTCLLPGFASAVRGRIAGAAAALAMLSGCHALRPVSPAPPQLVLIASQPLVLAEDCEAGGSFFVEFTVRTDGRIDELRLPAAPACVRTALSAWVGSLRYAPLPADMPAGIEWLMVSARKGS